MGKRKTINLEILICHRAVAENSSLLGHYTLQTGNGYIRSASIFRTKKGVRLVSSYTDVSEELSVIIFGSFRVRQA